MNILSILTSILIISGGMFNLATGRENITMGSINEEVIRLDLSNPNNLEKFLENINEGIELSDYENFAYYLDDSDSDNEGTLGNDNNSSNKEDKENNSRFLEGRLDNESIIKDGYGAYVKDGKIVMGSKNELLRIFTEGTYETGGIRLNLDQGTYEDTKDAKITYGYLFGEQPISLGGIDGHYDFETVMISGAMVQYPNFFQLDKNYYLDDKEAVSFKSKDGLMSFSLTNLKNYNNDNVKTLYNKETNNGDVEESECGEDWFYEYMERNGQGIYSLTVLDGDRMKGFAYSFPVQYKEKFIPIIEQSRKSFQVFNGFPMILKEQ
ncbi:hypothetical protein [Clostridium sp. B9]|uniref:hypothetical protein n=1 Tax=Clostridium sp. B9 TaxID=3423224 RepID=UPI003D2EE515